MEEQEQEEKSKVTAWGAHKKRLSVQRRRCPVLKRSIDQVQGTLRTSPFFPPDGDEPNFGAFFFFVELISTFVWVPPLSEGGLLRPRSALPDGLKFSRRVG